MKILHLGLALTFSMSAAFAADSATVTSVYKSKYDTKWNLSYTPSSLADANYDKIYVDGVEDRQVFTIPNQDRGLSLLSTYTLDACHQARVDTLDADQNLISTGETYNFGDTTLCDTTPPVATSEIIAIHKSKYDNRWNIGYVPTMLTTARYERLYVDGDIDREVNAMNVPRRGFKLFGDYDADTCHTARVDILDETYTVLVSTSEFHFGNLDACNDTPPAADTIAPVITLNGNARYTLTTDDTYTELGATATDNVDGTVAVTISGSVDMSTAGTYTLTYTAVDNAGNASSVQRVVTVTAVTTGCDMTTAITKEALKLMIANAEDVTQVNTCAITDMSWLVSIYLPGWNTDPSLSEAQKTNIGNFNQDISNWDVSNVTDMSYMFTGSWYYQSAFNQPIGNWDVSSVTNMQQMFLYATAFNQPIGEWDVSNVTNMYEMFVYATAFNQPIGDWDVSSVTNMNAMFAYITAFNQPIGDWDVSSVTNMHSMFLYTTAFNQPIGDWDVSSVTNMQQMFFYATAFNQPVEDWDVSSVTDMYAMFYTSTAFNQPLNAWDISNVINHDYFNDDSALTIQNLPNFP